MAKISLYHGSSAVVSKPIYRKGRTYNDFGQGFYCTKQIELAKEWACTEGQDGYVNEYEIDLDGLQVLRISEEAYAVLHWLALLLEYRNLRIGTSGMRRAVEWLQEHFSQDISWYDVIVGYRADDSYFSFVRSFLNNEIPLEQLSNAMRQGKDMEQIVLKSNRAFSKIKYCGYSTVDAAEYYVKRKNRDEEARRAFLEKAGRENAGEVYIKDLIRGEVSVDDLRLR